MSSAQIILLESPDYDFGDVNAGSVSEAVLNISNTGTSAASQISASVNQPFKFKGGSYPGLGGNCTSSLGVGSTCQVSVVFNPTSGDVSQEPLTINYLSGITESTATIQLLGTGLMTSPTHLSISSINGFTINKCYPIQVSTVTDLNIESVVTSGTTINLLVNNGTGLFYDNADCLNVISSTVISADQKSTLVYFKSSSAPQDLTLIATAMGLTSAQKSNSISNITSQLSLTGDSQIKLGVCRQIDVARLDASGYQVYDDAPLIINIAHDSQVTIFSDSNCLSTINAITIETYSSSKRFYIKNSTLTGNANISVAATDITISSTQLNINFVDQLSWWNPNWPYRFKLNLNNLDQNVAFNNQAVLIKLDSSKINYSAMKSDGTDLRILNTDDLTELSYEIEKWNPVGESYVWVRIPLISASSQSDFIYLYFGNLSAGDIQNKNDVWIQYNSVWHLNEDLSMPAAQILDSSSSNRHGTLQNAPTSSYGVIGSGINLNGDSDSFDVGNLAPVLGTTTTMSFWMKTSQIGNNTNWLAPGITGVEQAGGANDIFFGWINGGGYLGMTVGNSAGALSNFIVNNNAWRHITVSRHSTTGICSFYVNGVLNGSSNCGAGDVTTAFSQIGIIADTGGTPTEFDGELDEIRIFNTVKTDAEIKADYKFQNQSHIIFGAIEMIP
ncbi:MAG: hypothetical protein A2622_09545 [Bdellovibrionales bacterium RIFCSPHIGHO2_01_FULL_40_29]|nr:MAG: hypothetical protein A2622_09545 [Bdellovibrionales bacterium RIFCSPHIGHO2_01_FULL_40_29]